MLSLRGLSDYVNIKECIFYCLILIFKNKAYCIEIKGDSYEKKRIFSY